jgi:hypothetical protein
MPLFGYGSQNEMLPTQTPQQTGLANSLGQLGLQGIKNYNPAQFDFQPIANKARNNFLTQTLPSISERFTAMGGQNRLGSGNFNNAQTQAGIGLDTNLAALEQQYNLQREGNALQRQGQLGQFAQLGLQPQFENMYTPPSSGILGGLAGGLGQAAGTAGSLYALGGLGGAGTAATAPAAAAGATAAGGATGLSGLLAALGGPAVLGTIGGIAGLYALYNYLNQG